MKSNKTREELKQEIYRLSVEYFKTVHSERLDKEIANGSKKFVMVIEHPNKPFMLIIVESEI